MKLARTLGAIGRVLITAGVLILLFVAYQLWGTGIRTAQAQDDARSDFEEQVEQYNREHPDPRPLRPGQAQPVPHAPPRGEMVGRIQIPSIGVDDMFFEGVGLDVLASGPGHYEGTPLPGQEGNAGIAGHRTTYGAPFNRIDELGDGRRDHHQLLQRLAVHLPLQQHGDRQPRPGRRARVQVRQPPHAHGLPSRSTARRSASWCPPILQEPAAPFVPLPDSGEAASLAGRRATSTARSHAKTPAVVWGIAAAMVWLAAWVVGRAWRRWPAYAIGLPIFLVVLYGFFENFAYLLPASY